MIRFLLARILGFPGDECVVWLQDILEYKKKKRPQKIRMLDGSVKTVMVDDSKTVGELLVTICSRIGEQPLWNSIFIPLLWVEVTCVTVCRDGHVASLKDACVYFPSNTLHTHIYTSLVNTWTSNWVHIRSFYFPSVNKKKIPRALVISRTIEFHTCTLMLSYCWLLSSLGDLWGNLIYWHLVFL